VATAPVFISEADLSETANLFFPVKLLVVKESVNGLPNDSYEVSFYNRHRPLFFKSINKVGA
jgi:hypothetical protein